MRQYRIVLYGLLILGAFYTLWFVFAGFGNHQDPLYWLYKYEHLQGGWMAAGTLLTGGLIVKIFGAQLLPLRLFGWFCVVAAILLPFFCLVPKEKRRDCRYWVVLVITFVLMGYGAFQEFSPGTLSVLLLSALWVSKSKSYIKHNTSYIPAILAGLAIAARFPNILTLLVLIPLWKKRCLWNIPIAALSAGAVYLLAYWLLTPAPLDAAMGSHDFVPMLNKLWTSGGKLAGYLLMAAGVVAIAKSSLVPSRRHAFILSLFMGFALLYYIAYAIKPFQWYNIDLTYLISALIIVIAIHSYIIHKTSYILIGLLLLSVATLGTDTGWLKLFPALLCLLPVALCAHDLRTYARLALVLNIVGVITMWRMSTNSVGQSNLAKHTTFSSVAPYKGIAITPSEEARLLQIQNDCNDLHTSYITHNTSILSVGQDMHLFRAVTGCDAARFNEFWSNIYDSVYTAKYRPIIEVEHPVVFVTYTPQYKTKPEYRDGQSRFENMLRELGYTEMPRTKYKYIIYEPEIR